MIDNLASSRLRTLHAEPSRQAEIESIEDCGAFGWLRGVRDRALMLECRRRSGYVGVFGYSWLHPAFFNPSGELVLQFGAQRVVIRGRNLQQEVSPNVTLLSCLARHRVTWIAESESSLVTNGKEPLIAIESIEFK